MSMYFRALIIFQIGNEFIYFNIKNELQITELHSFIMMIHIPIDFSLVLR